MIRLCLIVIVYGLVAGCWNTHVTNGMVFTRSVELGNPTKTYRVDYSRKVCDYNRKHIIYIFPTGWPSPEEAIDDAIDNSNGQSVVGLANAQLRWRWFYIPPIIPFLAYGQIWYSVHGYPVYEVDRKSEPVREVQERSKTIQPSKKEPPRPQEKKQETVPADGFDDLPF